MQNASVPYPPPYLPVDPDQSATMAYRATMYLVLIQLGSALRLHLGQQHAENMLSGHLPHRGGHRVAAEPHRLQQRATVPMGAAAQE